MRWRFLDADRVAPRPSLIDEQSTKIVANLLISMAFGVNRIAFGRAHSRPPLPIQIFSPSMRENSNFARKISL